MRFFEGLAELLFPTRCAGCEMPGDVLCQACRDALPRIDAAWSCPRCGAPYGYLTCTECWSREWAFASTVALGEFEAPLSRAVVLHKDAGERRLATTLGTLLAHEVFTTWPGWPERVAFVPATNAAVRRRGFDHGRAIAVALAGTLGLPVIEALGRTEARDQRLLDRQERAANVSGTFSATESVSGRVLLTDDVFTTGATLDAASSALLCAGAQEVRVAVVARTW